MCHKHSIHNDYSVHTRATSKLHTRERIEKKRGNLKLYIKTQKFKSKYTSSVQTGNSAQQGGKVSSELFSALRRLE